MSGDTPMIDGRVLQKPTDAELKALKNRLNPEDPEARLIWDYLARTSFCGVTTHVPGDPHTSAFNEGQRVRVIRLGEVLGVNPIDYLKRR